MSYVVLALRGILGIVFAVAATSKLRRSAYVAFVESLRVLVPTPALIPVAMAVIFAEVTIPILVVVPALSRLGAGLAAFTLAAFVLGIGVLLRRGSAVSCRCFGASETPLGPWHLARNGALLLIAVTVMIVTGPDLGRLDLAGVVVALTGSGLVALLLIRLGDIAELFAPLPDTATPPQPTPPSRARTGFGPHVEEAQP